MFNFVTEIEYDTTFWHLWPSSALSILQLPRDTAVQFRAKNRMQNVVWWQQCELVRIFQYMFIMLMHVSQTLINDAKITIKPHSGDGQVVFVILSEMMSLLTCPCRAIFLLQWISTVVQHECWLYLRVLWIVL